VKGGMPGTEADGRIWGDYLVEVTKQGKTVWEWRTWDHLDPVEYPIPFVQNQRSKWTHGNSVAELADGNLLVSFRNISTVVRSTARRAA
jgi:Arylsulfotransferase (ASST)